MSLLHLTTTFVSSFQKTATTQCGKKVAVSKIALDQDATCPECRAHVEELRAAIIAVGQRLKTSLPSDTPALVEVLKLAAEPVDYRSRRFL